MEERFSEQPEDEQQSPQKLSPETEAVNAASPTGARSEDERVVEGPLGGTEDGDGVPAAAPADGGGVYPQPGLEFGSEAAPVGPKPLLSRSLNRLGIPTGRFMDGLLDWIQVLAVAAFLAWLTMSYVVVRMRVPTGSMEPTIHAGSSFFVDKLSFDFRQPIPGDIIVFWHNENSEKRVRYVKRMIATAGQTVQIKDCVKYPPAECGIYIDGKKQRDKAFDRPYYSGGKMGEQVWTVPEGHYFALGDNSRNSLDGRFWGFVDAKDFIGEPFLRVWPLNQFGFMNRYLGSAP